MRVGQKKPEGQILAEEGEGTGGICRDEETSEGVCLEVVAGDSGGCICVMD